MKRLLYLLLRKDMIRRLRVYHGSQFTNDVLETFGLDRIGVPHMRNPPPPPVRKCKYTAFCIYQYDAGSNCGYIHTCKFKG